MLNRKEKILISAIDLLYKNGINGVTTKNLATVQGVSEPALYRQYKSKLDIIQHIIEAFSSYDEKIMNTIMESEIKGKTAILFYVKRFAELYQNYKELTTVMYSMDMYQYNDNTKKTMQDITIKKLNFLEKIIREDKDLSNHAYEAVELASVINGLIFSVVYEWRIIPDKFSLEERLMTIIEKVL